MAKEEVASPDSKQQEMLEHLQKRLDLLDERLDNIDSIVTVVTERIMKQPITITFTCPKCGGNVEIALVGVEKPRR